MYEKLVWLWVFEVSAAVLCPFAVVVLQIIEQVQEVLDATETGRCLVWWTCKKIPLEVEVPVEVGGITGLLVVASVTRWTVTRQTFQSIVHCRPMSEVAILMKSIGDRASLQATRNVPRPEPAE